MSREGRTVKLRCDQKEAFGPASSACVTVRTPDLRSSVALSRVSRASTVRCVHLQTGAPDFMLEYQLLTQLTSLKVSSYAGESTGPCWMQLQ